MRKWKNLVTIFLVVLLSSGIAFASGQSENQDVSSVSSEKTELPEITWKLAGVHAVTTPETKSLNYFADLVKDKSNGKLIIEIYPAGQLGKDAVVLVENLMMGSIEMFGNSMDWNQHLVKDYAILGMPFLFEDIEAVKEFQTGDIYQGMGDQMVSERNVRILADNWYRLPKVILAKKPIESVDDIQGLNMRMPSLITYFDTWKGLGAKPTVIPWAEAFLALKKGVVESLDSPLGSIYGMKFYQAAPYIIMTNHLVAPFDILVNETKFRELPEEYQDILRVAGKDAGDYYSSLVEEMFLVDKIKMEKEGAVFLEIDTTDFKQKAAVIAASFEEKGMWQEGLFLQIIQSQK